MAEGGPERVTTTAIASRMGVSQAALFKHFPTKDAIWIAATDAIAARITPCMAELAQRRGPPLETVCLVVEGYVSLARETPAIAALLCYTALSAGDADLRRRVLARFQRLHELIGRLLRRARDQEELRAGIDTEQAARLFVAIVQTSLLPSSAGSTLSDPAAARQLADGLADLLKC